MIQTKTEYKNYKSLCKRVYLTTTLPVTDVITNLLFKKNLKNKTLYNCIFTNSSFKNQRKSLGFWGNYPICQHFALSEK